MNDHILSLQEDSEFRSALSPVSPKPRHYPQPSNIPILQYQMDPALNESSTFPGPQTASEPMQATEPATQDDALKFSRDLDAKPDVVMSVQQEAVGDTVQAARSEQIEQVEDVGQGEENDASMGMAIEGASDLNADTPKVTVAVSDEEMPVSTSQMPAMSGDVDVDVSTMSASAVNGIDIQALLNSIVNGTPGEPMPPQIDAFTAVDLLAEQNPPSQTSRATSLDPQPVAAANVSQHPYSGAPGTLVQPNGIITPVAAVGAPGTSAATATGLAPPPSATFQQPSQTLAQPVQDGAADGQNQYDATGSDEDAAKKDEDRRWGPEVQQEYDSFLEAERHWVSKGEWDKFPINSRLFLGNLSSESVTKRDLFHVFHRYGKLAQVSIKQAYGFVQFLESEDCLRALQSEQGVAVRGKKIHLEISKPSGRQKQGRDRNRRSRSPDRNGNGRQRQGDHYRGGGRDGRGRQRSPSPRGRHGRRRSRSRSPYASRYRSPSPRRGMDDDCPLPRRAPHEIPDVQIIVHGDPDRGFVNYVEKAFEARGLRHNVLLLSPRLSEAAVMRRQIIEGVLAVIKLDHIVQAKNKYSISVFDRSAGAANVRFDEYSDLDLVVIVELVNRAKQTAKPQYDTYQTGPYGLPMVPPSQAPVQMTPLPPAQSYYGAPHAAQQFQNVDPNALQSLLSRAQAPAPSSAPYGVSQPLPPTSDQMPELSRLLASVAGAPSGQQQPGSAQQLLASLAGSSQMQQSMYGQQQRAPPPQQQQQPQQQPLPQQQYQSQAPVDMKNILAGLSRWKG